MVVYVKEYDPGSLVTPGQTPLLTDALHRHAKLYTRTRGAGSVPEDELYHTCGFWASSPFSSNKHSTGLVRDTKIVKKALMGSEFFSCVLMDQKMEDAEVDNIVSFFCICDFDLHPVGTCT